MSAPKRIQRSRAKGSRLPRGAITVTRPGAWGNPFAIDKPNMLGFGMVKDAEHAVWLFTRWFDLRHGLVLFERERHLWMTTHLEQLRGADLACWCAPDQPCHATVLIARANVVEHFDPDCRDGKHKACSGQAWDDTTDALTPCTCPCHAATPADLLSGAAADPTGPTS